MPSRKTIVVLILCIAAITSTWLLLRMPVSVSDSNQNTSAISASSYENSSTTEEASNADWQKILVNVNPADQSSTATNDTPIENSSTFDETTLTAQMSRDIFSRYLSIANQGQDIPPQAALQIVNTTLATPQYADITGAVYVKTNLNIVAGTDKDTVKKYYLTFNLSIANRIKEIKTPDDPMAIVDKATQTNDQNEITNLDSIIEANKGVVSDLLKMEVPSDATTLHLAVLNSSSNILSDLESMRQVFSDPVKSLSGIKQYSGDINTFVDALGKIQVYFNQKLGLNL